MKMFLTKINKSWRRIAFKLCCEILFLITQASQIIKLKLNVYKIEFVYPELSAIFIATRYQKLKPNEKPFPPFAD